MKERQPVNLYKINTLLLPSTLTLHSPHSCIPLVFGARVSIRGEPEAALPGSRRARPLYGPLSGSSWLPARGIKNAHRYLRLSDYELYGQGLLHS